MKIVKTFWFPCPKCGNPKMIKLRPDTKLINFPGYCKKCKRESIVNVSE